MEKIGEINYGKYKTEIKITKKVKDYLKNERVSLSSLIPNGWEFYDVLLFEHIDKNNDGIPDEKFKDKFLIIYNGITEEGKWSNEKGLETKGFKDKINQERKIIFYSRKNTASVKNPLKKFIINYFVAKNSKNKRKIAVPKGKVKRRKL